MKSEKRTKNKTEKVEAITEAMPADLLAQLTEKEAEIVELIPGITSEEVTALFFNNQILISAPYRIFQLNSKGRRYYYRYDEKGNPEFFPSVTTILSQTMPTPPHLLKWIADRGIEEADRIKNERASYGTFMHAAFEELIINRSYDMDGLKGKLKEYIEINRLPEDFIYYADDLKKDILSFAQFVIDYDVQPLAVEIALVHPFYKYAGMIDLPCTMLDRIGGEDRINAIIDFKSGKKGFFEEMEIQLGMYRDMWNVNFEKHPITRIFNFAPKDWRKKPSYHLKEQTDSPNIAKIPSLLEIAAIEDAKRENTFTSVSGRVSLDVPDLSKNILSLSLSELVKSKAPQNSAPEVSPEPTPEKTDDKVKIVKRVVKRAKETEKKSKKTKTKSKGIITPKKNKKPAKVKKEAKNEKQNLLTDNLEI